MLPASPPFLHIVVGPAVAGAASSSVWSSLPLPPAAPAWEPLWAHLEAGPSLRHGVRILLFYRCLTVAPSSPLPFPPAPLHFPKCPSDLQSYVLGLLASASLAVGPMPPSPPYATLAQSSDAPTINFHYRWHAFLQVLSHAFHYARFRAAL